jgi:hypothetical protein
MSENRTQRLSEDMDNNSIGEEADTRHRFLVPVQDTDACTVS